jgi:hypothetical protein
MIVSLPEDAADTIWRSIDLLILALKPYFDKVYKKRLVGEEDNGRWTLCKAACFIKMGFLGAIVLCPFFVLAAACRAFLFVGALV